MLGASGNVMCLISFLGIEKPKVMHSNQHHVILAWLFKAARRVCEPDSPHFCARCSTYLTRINGLSHARTQKERWMLTTSRGVCVCVRQRVVVFPMFQFRVALRWNLYTGISVSECTPFQNIALIMISVLIFISFFNYYYFITESFISAFYK